MRNNQHLEIRISQAVETQNKSADGQAAGAVAAGLGSDTSGRRARNLRRPGKRI